MARERVIIVDDNASNLQAAKNVLVEKYEVFTFNSASKMFSSINEVKPVLILLDIDMPGMDGFKTIELLKTHPETSEIPVIFLTGLYDIPTEIEGLQKGAVDYITKPFVPELLLQRVGLQVLIENQKKALRIQTEQLEEQRWELVQMNAKLKKLLIEKEEDG